MHTHTHTCSHDREYTRKKKEDAHGRRAASRFQRRCPKPPYFFLDIVGECDFVGVALFDWVLECVGLAVCVPGGVAVLDNEPDDVCDSEELIEGDAPIDREADAVLDVEGVLDDDDEMEGDTDIVACIEQQMRVCMCVCVCVCINACACGVCGCTHVCM